MRNCSYRGEGQNQAQQPYAEMSIICQTVNCEGFLSSGPKEVIKTKAQRDRDGSDRGVTETDERDGDREERD